MRSPLCLVAAMLPLAGAASAGAQESLPSAQAFAPGSGRVWLSECAFEAERYVSCRNAAPSVLEVISSPGDGDTPGMALQAFMRDLFVGKGCTFAVPPDSFRVNGIFLSFDSSTASEIRCDGLPSRLVFSPDGIGLLDTLYFFSGAPPR